MSEKSYQQYPYMNPDLPVENRIDDLLTRMTMEEKVGQMMQLPANKEGNMLKLETMHIGSYLHCTGSMMVELQKKAEQTRLGIPLIFGIDAIHGHCFHPRATVFPTQLSMSCSWNREAVKTAAEITAKEVRAAGIHWTFSPVLCVGRDARWGRIDETFGEDPWLIGELALAMIQGYQGTDLSSQEKILACAKHYAGYGETVGGRDAYEAEISRRKMLSLFLPPFEKAVRKGNCGTLMAAYQAIDGVPCSANRWLLEDTAKEKWNLDGFIVTDWDNTGSLHSHQTVAETLKEAAYLAITAGNDMIMSTPSFYDNTLELIREGRIGEDIIDRSVSRILKMKFKLGLFDHSRFPQNSQDIIGCDSHWEESLEISRQSIVLLKNNGILPLRPGINSTGDEQREFKILFVGTNGDDIIAQLGDWSFGSMQAGATEDDTFHRDDTVTLLQGLRNCTKAGFPTIGQSGAEQTSGKIRIEYIPCAGPQTFSREETESAVSAAGSADVIIACIGDTLKNHGEFHDRGNLDLDAGQQEMMDNMSRTGKPLVCVFMASKPLCIPRVKEQADAIICAFNPGAKGGQALAEVITGIVNPTGKLTISFPRHSGQIPVYYNKYKGWHSEGWETEGERYMDLPSTPLFAFGEGLSYTTFSYSNLRIKKPRISREEENSITVTVTNTGTRKGTEIVQMYINDCYSSVTTPVKELCGFERITLQPGESAEVEISIKPEHMALVTPELEYVVEPGEFSIFTGPSSKDEDLLKTSFIVC